MGARVNTVTSISETILPQLIESEDQQESEDQTQADKRRDEKRARLRLCLNEIASGPLRHCK
jgi:hypothetical protein